MCVHVCPCFAQTMRQSIPFRNLLAAGLSLSATSLPDTQIECSTARNIVVRQSKFILVQEDAVYEINLHLTRRHAYGHSSSGNMRTLRPTKIYAV